MTPALAGPCLLHGLGSVDSRSQADHKLILGVQGGPKPTAPPRTVLQWSQVPTHYNTKNRAAVS